MALTAAALETLFATSTSYYVALGTAASLSSFTELSGGGYARKAHAVWATTLGVGSATRTNNGAIVFDAFSQSVSVHVTHWAIFAAAEGGSALVYGALASPVTISVGDQPRVNDATLRITTVEEG